MKRIYLLSIFLLAATAWVLHQRLDVVKRDRDRLQANQAALLDSVRHYRTAAGREAASVGVLQLKVDELRRDKADAARQIRDLGIRLRRVEATAAAATRTEVTVRAPLADTVVVRLRDTIIQRDTVRLFRWRDAWVEVEGCMEADSVHCRVASVDTLRQVVHRVPRRFLFIRWGTKAIRQEIVSSNPHTRIVYSEYIQVRRK